MDKREALKILLEHSFFLPDEVKEVLLLQLPSLTEEDVESIGKLLAIEKRKSLEGAEVSLENLDKVLATLPQPQ